MLDRESKVEGGVSPRAGLTSDRTRNSVLISRQYDFEFMDYTVKVLRKCKE